MLAINILCVTYFVKSSTVLQVQRTVSSCFAALYELWQIRHSVPSDTFRIYLVHSRLDYCNIVSAGFTTYLKLYAQLERNWNKTVSKLIQNCF